MLRHYLEVKAEHPDAVLIYRMGDFFEMFFEDAVRAAPILEVTLTARHKGTANETPMCGVPHHAVNSYLGKLLKAGLKVAICDQVEDPAEAKGLVKREVTRVVTPGTVSDPDLLEGKEEHLLASLAWRGEEGAGAFLEVSTGRFFVRRWRSVEEGIDDLRVLSPREVLVPDDGLPAGLEAWIERSEVCATSLEGERYLAAGSAAEEVRRQLGVATLKGLGLDDGEPAVEAAGAALAYGRATQHSELEHVRQLSVSRRADAMILDPTTVANLELFRNQRQGGRRGTLLSVVDRTVTATGGRRLREWLRRPLRDPEEIADRLDAVAELVEKARCRDRLRELLGGVGDPERLLSRAVLGTISPREAAALRDGLTLLPEILAELADLSASRFAVLGRIDPLHDLAERLRSTLEEEPAAQLQRGGVIAEGVDEELDRARSLARDSKRHILGMETAEREATGIPSLKIRFNKVFGYYLEVTKAHQDRVPEHYVRKQTLVNAERYVTDGIKELEERILDAEQRQIALEEEHFVALVAQIVAAGEGLTELGAALGELDALANFAEIAVRHDYRRPRVTGPGHPIVIREGRHPVVERAGGDRFVPNDCTLDGEGAQVVLLTGPNMGGKSTYLRQVALIVLLAQAGSFVPARSAEIGAVDRIFTRVGASDDLSRGESTFMVEMIETANILHHATGESLVILDEVGRGTSTFDGLSLAWAIVERLHEERRPLTLFATHYHELTELASLLPRVVNRTLAVKEWEDKIVFLRRVVDGAADKSYGLHVARLAGVPSAVIDRAREILGNLEEQEYDLTGKPRLARGDLPDSATPDQLRLFAPAEEVIAGIVRELDVERLTPVAALNLLYSLKKRL